MQVQLFGEVGFLWPPRTDAARCRCLAAARALPPPTCASRDPGETFALFLVWCSTAAYQFIALLPGNNQSCVEPTRSCNDHLVHQRLRLLMYVCCPNERELHACFEATPNACLKVPRYLCNRYHPSTQPRLIRSIPQNSIHAQTGKPRLRTNSGRARGRTCLTYARSLLPCSYAPPGHLDMLHHYQIHRYHQCTTPRT